jgi:hypothetical protein
MTAAMQHVAATLCVPSDDARLLRLTNNAVYALPSAGFVIRITRSHGLHARVHKVTRLGTWFAQVHAPTIRLAPGHDQPIPANAVLATVWTYISLCPPEPTVQDLGPVLRQFHVLGTPPFDLPAWNPVKDARHCLADAEALPARHRRSLSAVGITARSA